MPIHSDAVKMHSDALQWNDWCYGNVGFLFKVKQFSLRFGCRPISEWCISLNHFSKLWCMSQPFLNNYCAPPCTPLVTMAHPFSNYGAFPCNSSLTVANHPTPTMHTSLHPFSNLGAPPYTLCEGFSNYGVPPVPLRNYEEPFCLTLVTVVPLPAPL